MRRRETILICWLGFPLWLHKVVATKIGTWNTAMHFWLSNVSLFSHHESYLRRTNLASKYVHATFSYLCRSSLYWTFFCVCAYVYMDCPADQAFIQYLDNDLYAVGGIMQGLVICSASPPSLWCERYCALAMGAKPGSSLDTRVAKTETNSNPTSKKARKGTETLFPFNITRSDGCWRDTYFHTKEVQRVRFFHEIQYNKHFFSFSRSKWSALIWQRNWYTIFRVFSWSSMFVHLRIGIFCSSTRYWIQQIGQDRRTGKIGPSLQAIST